MFWERISTVHLTVSSYHLTYAFQSESTLFSCQSIKELLAWSRLYILSLSECNWSWTCNQLVDKWTLIHVTQLAKWLICVTSAYLHGAFYSMFLSCHLGVSEWIHTLKMPECEGNPCSRQECNLKFKLLQLYSNMQPLPPRLKLTLPWGGGFPSRSFYPSASTRRAQLRVAAKVVRPTDLLKNVTYWFIID